MAGSVSLWLRRIPLKRPFKTALRTVTVVEDLVLVVECDGVAGYGSAAPTVAITGDDYTRISASLQAEAVPWIRDTMTTSRLSTLRCTSSSASYMVETALYDLISTLRGKSVVQVLGDLTRNLMTNDVTISIDEPEIMASDAYNAVHQGASILKLKVGRDARMDLKRMEQICEVVPDNIKLRLDANQSWNLDHARYLFNAFEKRRFPIDLIEQPVPGNDLQGMCEIRKISPYPIMADESMFNSTDAQRIIEAGAADILNIKLAKCGGYTDALKICALAQDAGLECMVGCMMEGPIGIVAAAQLAFSQPSVTRADLDCPLLYSLPVGGYSTKFIKDKIFYEPALGLGIVDASLKTCGGMKLWEETI